MLKLVLMMGLFGASPEYKDAFNKADREEAPLVVMFGAEWCGWCPNTERLVKEVYPSAVHLDVDKDEELSRRFITNVKSWPPAVPQIHLYFKRNGKWHHKFLIGAEPKSKIESFIKQGQK